MHHTRCFLAQIKLYSCGKQGVDIKDVQLSLICFLLCFISPFVICKAETAEHESWAYTENYKWLCTKFQKLLFKQIYLCEK